MRVNSIVDWNAVAATALTTTPEQRQWEIEYNVIFASGPDVMTEAVFGVHDEGWVSPNKSDNNNNNNNNNFGLDGNDGT